MHVDGWVKRIDVAAQSAVITTRTSEELILHFDEGSYIEVLDPTNGGTMPGALASLPPWAIETSDPITFSLEGSNSTRCRFEARVS